MVFIGQNKVYANVHEYPSASGGNLYAVASRCANPTRCPNTTPQGVYLHAPVSFNKINFDASATYFDVSVDDLCFQSGGLGIDYSSLGVPGSCRLGDVSIQICGTNNQGNKRTDAGCFMADAASLGNNYTFNLEVSGSGTGRRDMFAPPHDGVRTIYIAVQQNVTGLNGMRFRARAYTVFGIETDNTKIGFGESLDPTDSIYPQSIVHLPLSSNGEETITLRFKPPCTFTGNSFEIEWFDADRPPSDTPRDDNINWTLTKMAKPNSPAVTRSAQYFANNRGIPNLDEYLGGQSYKRRQLIRNSDMEIEADNEYEWQWTSVNNNNGVQFYLPFSSADTVLKCDKPPTVGKLSVSGTANCEFVSGWAIDQNDPNKELSIRIYRDRPQGQSGSVTVTGGYRADDEEPRIPNPPAWVDNDDREDHGFNVNIRSHISGGVTRTFYIYSNEVDVNGNLTSNYELRLTETVTCPLPSGNKPTGRISASCDFTNRALDVSVAITVEDADSPNPTTQQYTVDFYIDRAPPSSASGTTVTTTIDGVKTAIFKSTAHFDLNTHDVRAVIRGVNNAGANAVPNSTTLQQLSVLPCQLSCSTDRPIPNTAYPQTTYRNEPNRPGNQVVNVHIKNNGTTDIPIRLDIVDVHFPQRADPPGSFNPGDSVSAPLGPFPQTNQPMYNYITGSRGAPMTVIKPGEVATYASPGFSLNNFPQGVYPILVRFGGIDFAPNCGSFIISYAPYLKVFGGEVFAGSKLGDSTDLVNCPGWGRDSISTEGSIDSFTTGNRGSSTNLATYSIGETKSFNSAGQRTLAPISPLGLTFRNVPSTPYGSIGVDHCPYDYFNKKLPEGPNGTVNKTSGTNRFNAAATNNWIDTLSGSSRGSYYFNTSGTPLLLGGQSILNGTSCSTNNPKSITLYVDGSVQIAGNIIFSDAAPTCALRVPRFILVARGNIHVSANVTRLD
ncbi:MAG: hypothetical protein AAB459_02935, partial [Patescibacteria group bacterium]